MKKELTIGDWLILPATGQVIRDNSEQRLEPRAMDVLVYLADHAGEIVSREELEQQVWKGTVVTYEALTVTINKIRAALEDDSRCPQYIETLPKRGYRLIADVNGEQHNLSSTTNTKKTQTKIYATVIILLLVATLPLLILINKSAINPADDTQLTLLNQDLPSIAVIPFANNNNDTNQDYFAAGITEYLITDLSRLSTLLVTSRNSVLGFNSKSADIKTISQTLNVRYVLTGSVLKNENQMRIAVQLTDAENGIQIWADRFDRKVNDLFQVQDEIINKIVAELVKQVGDSEQAIFSRNYTTNHEAHDYFIRGNALYTSISKEGNSLAREMFLKAIEIDPRFSSAYGAIALTYVDDYRRKWGEDPAGAVDRAFEYANKAIAIDKNAAVAYVVLAYVHLYGRKEPEKAINAAMQAIKLYPNYADAYAITGSAYSFISRSKDAIRVNLHAMRLNPTSSYIYYANLGRDYYFLNQPDKAINSLQEAIFRNENYLNAHIYLAATYASLGRISDARWEVDKIMILDPEFSLDYWASTQPYRSKSRLDRMVSDLHKASLRH